jgi:hypothetical protein
VEPIYHVRRVRRVVLIAALLGLTALVAGGTSTAAGATVCPAAWRAGWQALANRIHAPVYCPSWMPNPLDGQIRGESWAGTYVDPQRAYLVSFLVSDPAGMENEEVHVNFRGYPGRAATPVCTDTLIAKGRVYHPRIPCFSGRAGTLRLGGKLVTVYTANQGVDQWHILYAWQHAGSLYAVSEHVIIPYTYSQVRANLDRLVRGLVLVRPA